MNFLKSAGAYVSKYANEFAAGILLIVAAAAAYGSGGFRSNNQGTSLTSVTVIASVAALLIILRKHLPLGLTTIGQSPSDAPTRHIALLILVGMIGTWIYAGVDPERSVKVAAALTLVLAASLTVGLLGGFLFGLPRFAYGDGMKYNPSANLDEIADWLTKIIVGVGLIELKEVGPRIQALATYLAPKCVPAGCHVAPTSTVLVYGVTCGFLYAYIWTRLNYAALAAKADIQVIGDLNVIGKKEAASLGEIGVGGSARLAEAASREGNEDAPARASLPAAAAQEEGGLLSPTPDATAVKERSTVVDPDDQNKGQFGGLATVGDRVLRAQFSPSVKVKDYWSIRLTVTSTNPQRPLVGAVVFHLHQSFSPSSVRRKAVDGVAELVVVAWGAFTVGAEIKSENVRLELDLALHPEAPSEFRNR